jgi:O-antigen/teichoic acid export membrane protein
VVYAAVVFISARLLGYNEDQVRLLWVLAGNQFLSMFILYFRTNISGLQYYRTDSLLSVLDRSLMILFTGLLLWGNITEQPFRIAWFVYAQTLSYSLTLLTVAAIARYRSGAFIHKINLKRSLEILRLSYPFALLILLMSLFNRIDSVMLERMLEHGKSEAGVYAQSFRILDAASQFPVLFAMLLLPMFSRMIKLGNDVNELIRTALPLLMIAALSLAVVAWNYGWEVIHLLYPAAPEHSAQIFALLMTGFIFISISYIYGTLLTANHSLKALNILAASTVILNLVLNLILIPRHHATGAAISSLTSQLWYALGQVFLSRRLLHIPWNGDILIKLLAFLALNMAAGYLSHLIPGWVPGLSLLLASCLLSIFLLRLIRPSEVLDIMKNKG